MQKVQTVLISSKKAIASGAAVEQLVTIKISQGNHVTFLKANIYLKQPNS